MFSRRVLTPLGAVLLLVSLIPEIGYIVIAPQNIVVRILGFVLATPFAVLWGFAPYLWKTTRLRSWLERSRLGRGVNHIIIFLLEAVGVVLGCQAISVLIVGSP